MSYLDSCKKTVENLELTDLQKEAIYQVENLKHVGAYILSVAKELYEYTTGYEVIMDYIENHIKEFAESFILKYKDPEHSDEDVVKEMLTNHIKEHFRYYKVPVTWEMCGTVTVFASSPENAVDYVDKNPDEFDLPEEDNYVDDSFRLSSDSFEENVAMVTLLKEGEE